MSAADSIAVNLSTGFGRYHYLETNTVGYYSRGSLFETKTRLTKAYNRKLIKDQHSLFYLIKLNQSELCPTIISIRLGKSSKSTDKAYPLNDAQQMTTDDAQLMTSPRLHTSFFLRDVLEVAPDLLGKTLVRRYDDATLRRFTISETEAYRGVEDRACHASKGRTARTVLMFREGGLVYVYFVYGMYWMLNFVTGNEGNASAVLIRGLDQTHGPGRVGKILALDRSFYGENLEESQRLWMEDSGIVPSFTTHPRVGIGYAGEPWISMPWRYTIRRDI